MRAPRSFIPPLARRLLSHPNGSGLAVVGHVDRTWTRSFGSGRGMGYLHIVSLLKRLRDGYPVGAAMDWMNERFATTMPGFSSSWGILRCVSQTVRGPH